MNIINKELSRIKYGLTDGEIQIESQKRIGVGEGNKE